MKWDTSVYDLRIFGMTLVFLESWSNNVVRWYLLRGIFFYVEKSFKCAVFFFSGKWSLLGGLFVYVSQYIGLQGCLIRWVLWYLVDRNQTSNLSSFKLRNAPPSSVPFLPFGNTNSIFSTNVHLSSKWDGKCVFLVFSIIELWLSHVSIQFSSLSLIKNVQAQYISQDEIMNKGILYNILVSILIQYDHKPNGWQLNITISMGNYEVTEP